MIELVRSRGRGADKRVVAVAINEDRQQRHLYPQYVRLQPRLGGTHTTHHLYPFYQVEIRRGGEEGAASIGDFRAPRGSGRAAVPSSGLVVARSDLFPHPFDIAPRFIDDEAYMASSTCVFVTDGPPASLPCMPALATIEAMTILEWLFAQAIRAMFER